VSTGSSEQAPATAGASAPPDSLQGTTTERRQGLAVATAFLSLFSIVGFALYGLPFFYDSFVTELGWTRQQVTSGNAYSKLLIGPLFGYLAGMFVDRFGPRRLMLFGILVAGLALVGLGGVTTLSAFYFFYLLNALGYVCGGPLPNQVMLSGWFSSARGRAMGIAYLGIGIGGTLVPLLAVALTDGLGWRGAIRGLGVLIILIALPAAILVKEPPRIASTAPTDMRWVFRQPAFYLLALGSMASIGAVGGTMQNLKLYLSLDRGFSQKEAAFVLSLILFGSIGGRLLMGWLADRWPKKRVMLLIYVIVAATIPWLAFAPPGPALFVGALLFGIGLGGDYMIIPLMAAELFGLKVMGRLMGVVLTADGVAEAVVPVLVARVRDQSGSYGDGFLLLVALAALGALAIAFLRRPAPAAPASSAA
jgi:sugar phosphate permease